MDGFWFWWGTTLIDDSDFVALWQYTYNYMTNNMGLDNIVWAWAGQADWSRYPGDNYVDIVGQDLYSSDPAAQGQPIYDNQTNFGKLIALTEFGPSGPDGGNPNFNETTLVAAIQNTMPNVVYWLQWWDENAGGIGWGMSLCQDVAEALNDPWVINRGEIGFFNQN